jgi:hypothetical protein
MAWPANSLIEVRMLYTVNLQKCMNVFHYVVSGVTTGFTVPELTEEFATTNVGPANGTWDTEFSRVLSTDAEITAVDVQLVYPERWRAFRIVTNREGIRDGTCNAQNLQASITKLGERANRANQGGMRVGGVPEPDYIGGLITAPYKTVLETLVLRLADFRSDGVTAATYIPAIANKEPIPGTNPVKFRYKGGTVIEQWFVERELRTQRTRTVGRGE